MTGINGGKGNLGMDTEAYFISMVKTGPAYDEFCVEYHLSLAVRWWELTLNTNIDIIESKPLILVHLV